MNTLTENHNEVLFISYPFPPLGAAGALRPFRFVKNLPSFKWRPIVLTIVERNDVPQDYSLLKQLTDEVVIHRTRTFFPEKIYEKLILNVKFFIKGTGDKLLDGKVFAKAAPGTRKAKDRVKLFLTSLMTTPDHHVLWVPIGFYRGCEIIKNNKIKLIYTTSPPHSSLIVGLLLKKKFRLPWVVDFRDPWVENFKLRGKMLKWQKSVEQKLEEMVIRNADSIIANTETNRSNLIKRYPGQPVRKFSTIHNGFDYIEGADKIIPYEKFTITHTGIFYPQVSPYFFFEALADWLGLQNEAERSDVQVLLIGESKEGETKDIVDNLKLNDVVKFVDRMPHREALNIACASDLLLASLGFKVAYKGWVPMKIYDYLACEKPIIAFLPEGEAATIIRETQSGYVVTSPDLETTRDIMHKEYLRKKNAREYGLVNRDFEKIAWFENRNLAKKLVGIFNRLV